MKIARLYLRVSTDEQDLTRHTGIEDSTRSAGYYIAASIERRPQVLAPIDPSFCA